MSVHSAPIGGDNGDRERKIRHTVRVLSRVEELTPEILEKLIECSKGVFRIKEENYPRFFKEALLNGARIYYVLNSKGEVMGYGLSRKAEIELPDAAGKLSSENTFSFNSSVVNKKYEGQGIYSDINRLRIAEALESKPAYVYVSTQNPVVELAFRNAFERAKEEKQSSISDLQFVLDRINNPKGEGRSVTRDAPPKCGVKEIDDRYATLDYENGETFYVSVNLKYK